MVFQWLKHLLRMLVYPGSFLGTQFNDYCHCHHTNPAPSFMPWIRPPAVPSALFAVHDWLISADDINAERLTHSLQQPLRKFCTPWRNWLRHCTTSQKVASSIPDVVTGIFSCSCEYGNGTVFCRWRRLIKLSDKQHCFPHVCRQKFGEII